MHKNILEFEYANDLIVYDPQNGSFKWRKTTCSRAIAGKKAGYAAIIKPAFLEFIFRLKIIHFAPK